MLTELLDGSDATYVTALNAKLRVFAISTGMSMAAANLPEKSHAESSFYVKIASR